MNLSADSTETHTQRPQFPTHARASESLEQYLVRLYNYLMTVSTPAAAGHDPVVLADRLRPVLWQLHRQLRGETLALGVTVGQVSILAAIRDRPGIGVAELASREGISVPSISAHVDKLEASALITRRRDVALDRRRVGLAITPDGQKVLRRVRSRRTAWLAARLATLTPQQRASVDAAIDGLSALVVRP